MYERGFLCGKLNETSYTVYEVFSEPPSSSTKDLLTVKGLSVMSVSNQSEKSA